MINNTIIIIQARLGSTRLPGKVLKPYFSDESILSIQLNNLKNLNLPIVVATTNKKADDAIVSLCKEKGVALFRGDEHDVLQRFIDAAEFNKAEKIVRICSDNPFLHIQSLVELLQIHKKNRELDYLSYKNNLGVPAIKTHWGLFAEIVSVDALRKVKNYTVDPLYLEHVTNFIYSHPEIFSVSLLPAPACVVDRDNIRLTIDTEEDFMIAQEIYSTFDVKQGQFDLKDLILTIDNHPEWKAVMGKGILNFSK